jgi:sugar (pentulose or hexulose) kinase
VTGQALLGMDLGTSGAKAVLLGAGGRLLAEAEAGYPVDSPHPGWAETDPPAWWRAVVTAVRAARHQAGGVDVAAVGVDGQMHGLVLTDMAGRPLRPALLWADARAVEETAARLADRVTAGVRFAPRAHTCRLVPMRFVPAQNVRRRELNGQHHRSRKLGYTERYTPPPAKVARIGSA